MACPCLQLATCACGCRSMWLPHAAPAACRATAVQCWAQQHRPCHCSVHRAVWAGSSTSCSAGLFLHATRGPSGSVITPPPPLLCRYRSTWGTLLYIARHEGPSALYRGFLPKAIRLGVGQTIGLMVFQKCLALVGASEAQHEQQQLMVMEGVAVAEQ